MNQIIPPPVANVDPALTAQTFTRNPALFASLERIRAQRAVNTGAEVPGGSDATDPCPIEPLASHELTYAHRYQVHTETCAGITAEIITVAADDIVDAIQSAIAQLVGRHADGVRVTGCREIKKRAAR